MKRLLELLAESWILLFSFLLPLKYGTIAVVPEAVSLFPDDLFSYGVINYPAVTFGFGSAPALLLALLAFPAAAGKLLSCAGGIFALLWSFGLVLLALPGLCHISTWDFAVLQLTHFGAIGCYAAAVMILALSGPERRKRLSAALGAGFLLAVWCGLEQYFWGFRRMREFISRQEAEGAAVGEVLHARIFDDRVYGSFTSSNSLAGYLLLITPFLSVLAWKLGKKFEPARVSQPLFAGITAAGGVAVYLMTKSRAGFLALALTAAGALFLLPVKRRFKVVAAGVIAAGILAGSWYIQTHGRGFRSMTARADYLRSSALLLAENPLAGCGWGNFFFRHVGIKLVHDHEAAHDPHNLVMTGAQAGIPLVLLLTAGLILPFAALWKKRPLPSETRAGLFGMAAFYLHSMMDIDLQIPGLMAIFFALTAILIAEDGEPQEKQKTGSRIVRGALLLLAIAVFAVSYREVQGERTLGKLQDLARMKTLPLAQQTPVTPEKIFLARQKACETRPYSAQPYIFAGDALFQTGDLDGAEQNYREALKRSPLSSALYARLARVALIRGDRAGADQLIRKAHELFPHNPSYQVRAE